MTGRSVRTFGDVVVSPHELASAAGIEVFAAGGSAVDASLATNAVLGVVAPETCGIGGDLFALVWEPTGNAPATLNSSGWAGSGAHADELRAAGHDSIPGDHPLTVTIPGCVAGWQALHDRYGRVPLGVVLNPAIRYAEDGFPASTELSEALRRRRDQLVGQPSAVDLYPNGTPPEVGTRVRRPLLATTISDITTGGAPAFYEGRPARDISAAVGGRITQRDLETYRPDWVEPAHIDVFGATGWTTPPNSQGYLTLAALSIFEAREVPLDDPAATHLLVEAYRAVAWERNELVADPVTAPMPWQELLAPSRLAARSAALHRDTVARWPAGRPAPPGTAFMCAVSSEGQAISLIQSNFMGIGSGIGAGTSGFLLHNRGGGFDLRAGHPNELVPGRRPLHTLSPTLWTRDGELLALLGTRGGHQQPQFLAQMAAGLFWRGLEPGDAQAAARWSMDEFGPGTPSRVLVEDHMDEAAVAHLIAAGHQVERMGFEGGWGPVSVITVSPEGLRTAAADPRVDTSRAAVR
ncbi:MAG: gamma-glutamyltransferase [Acidimicrobiia bacterium]|nr:gamma-glutamyltransferase [Acidimicrobiia bacterium]